MAFERENGIMVFYPTMEEFRDFYKFVSYMEQQGAHKMGVAKIVPPKEWSPKADFSNLDNFHITTPIQQYVNGAQGRYQQYNIQKKGLSFQKFKVLAESSQYAPPKAKDYDELERKYWKNVTYHQPLYGADIPGSFTDPDVKEWNINHLESILDTVQGEYGIKIPGVNTAYLYFGMWKTSFAWHTEDMDLYSINYLHWGEPKLWYAIPPEHGQRLERLARGYFPDLYDQCPQFLRHKMTIISPNVLRQYSIPVNKVIQKQGNFMITFPYGYHSGFNLGLNCAESTNFALERWVEYGKKATRCLCRSDGVHINMDMFVKKYQPDQWEEYYQQKYCAKPPGDLSSSSSALSLPGHRRMSQGPIIPTEALAITKPKRRRIEDPQCSTQQYVSAWAESLDGLWQWQRLDFPMEQAFNSLVSKDGTKCCVCTLLAPDDTFKPLDRDKLMKLYKKYQKQKAKRRVLGGSASIAVCQSLRIAVKRELIRLPHRIRKESSTVPDCSNPLPDSSTVSTLPISIPHSTNDATNLLNVEPDEQVSPVEQAVPDEQVLPDSTSNAIPITVKSSPAVVADSQNHDVSTTTTSMGQDQLSTPPRPHHSASPDHKRIRRSPRNFSSIMVPSTEHVTPLKPSSHQNDEVGSEMVTCAVCKICVHKSCYGIMSATPLPWMCARCTGNVVDAECCLCSLRGGALKPTTDGRWAHIVCVVTLPEVSFVNSLAREPVVVGSIPATRKKLKCHYCETVVEGVIKHKGLCVQCCRSRCYLPFHVTCAQYQGLPPPALEGLFGLLCHKHDPERKQKTVTVISGEFTIGQSVIAKMENNKYSSGVVESMEEELFYEVLFDQDCTVCYNLPPSDLLTKDAQKGSSVQVKWSDDKIYAAKLLGWHTSLAYKIPSSPQHKQTAATQKLIDPLTRNKDISTPNEQQANAMIPKVHFNDGSSCFVSEEDMYSTVEKLPKKVKSKLVSTT